MSSCLTGQEAVGQRLVWHMRIQNPDKKRFVPLAVP
jgi:hypothetical protein